MARTRVEPAAGAQAVVVPDNWYGCYDGTWKGLLIDEAFAHPAKFPIGLVRRIVHHAMAEDWLRRGDHVLDPFAGVGCGGLVCAANGLNWVGVELEKNWVDIGRDNIDRLRKLCHWPARVDCPRLVCGDSRDLREVLWGEERRPDAIISSAPSAANVVDVGHNEGPGSHGEEGRRGRRRATSRQGLGVTPGQLSRMVVGGRERFNAVISSPPYHNTALDQNPRPGTTAERMRRKGYSERDALHASSNAMQTTYGDTAGQLVREDEGEFWAAARLVILHCRELLRDGGYAVWNVKDFVRDGKRVELAGRWREMCESCGFRLVCHHRAVQSVMIREAVLFGPATREKDKKSMFKRQHDRKLPVGDPRRVDWEDVFCMRKV